MAKNRFNTVPKTVPNYTPKTEKKSEEVVLHFSPCCVCGAEITVGWYGRWGDGGVCSKHCNTLKTQMQLDFRGH